MPAPQRSYTSSQFALDLDGVQCGFLKSVEGGSITADVIRYLPGTGDAARKHLGPIKYEDFIVQFGFGMDKVLYDWIAASWAMNFQRKNGVVTELDYQGKIAGQREFSNALITETTIPACDAASKEPAYLTLKFAPEYTRMKSASGKYAGKIGKQQKAWLPSNFRLKIDGLDCTRVTQIDSFTVKQSIARDGVGDERDYQREPGMIEVPNLRIALAQSKAQSWYDWFASFVIQGNNDDSQEKNGSLIFLAANLGTELARIDLSHIGIFKLAPDPSAAKTNVKRVVAELYVEAMAFQKIS